MYSPRERTLAEQTVAFRRAFLSHFRQEICEDEATVFVVRCNRTRIPHAAFKLCAHAEHSEDRVIDSFVYAYIKCYISCQSAVTRTISHRVISRKRLIIRDVLLGAQYLLGSLQRADTQQY